MTFEEYLNEAWANHPTHSAELLKSFEDNLSLISSGISSRNDASAMGHLIAHVCGEHLGEWKKGIQLLKVLREHSQLKDQATLDRFIAALSLGEDGSFSLRKFNDSDKVRIYAMTATALTSQNDVARAGLYLEEAERICRVILDKKDAAFRSLALAANNIACTLEEKSTSTEEEINLMIRAAYISRKLWEMSGTWVEVERAEYRLAKIFLKADILDLAYIHAENCLEIIANNGNDPLEYFFGLEAMALIENARKNSLGYYEAFRSMRATLAKINPEDREWCKNTLQKIAGAEAPAELHI